MSVIPKNEINPLLLGTSNIWQVIAFEDSKNGDYDYNDLVIHCKYSFSIKENYKRLNVYIHPIALGSTKRIKLGFDVYQNESLIETVIVTDNVRDILFFNKEGFINTSTYNFDYSRFNYSSKTIYTLINSPISINWFIIIDDNTRLNAIATHHTNNMINKDNKPYGITITSTGRTYTQPGVNGPVGKDWFNYPLEGVNINTAYPLFDSWINGQTSMPFYKMGINDQNNKYLFDAVKNKLYYIK